MKNTLLLSVLIAIALVGCKKKEDKAADPATTTAGTGTAATPPPPDPNAGTAAGTGAGTGEMAGTGAGTGEMAGTGAGTAAPAGDMAELKPLPDGMPDDCKKAYDKMVKYRGCEKQPAASRGDMVKAWNMAVDGTFVHYKTAKGDTKATIEKTCTRMSSTFDMLIKDC